MRRVDSKSQTLPLDCVIELIHSPLGDKGEDAFSFDFSQPTLHTQAVFDGCGGAGAWKYPEYANATGAFVAANIMAEGYLNWFQSIDSTQLPDGELMRESYAQEARKLLQHMKDRCAPMGISGSMVKSFPCTASIAMMNWKSPNSLKLTVLNVGDSRVYALLPKFGLVQITTDDSRGYPDAMRSLIESAPLSDMLNADRAFSLKMHEIVFNAPCAILCATDGVFGYLRSPMDFEFLLLHTLMHANSFSDFEQRFKDEIVNVTGDDCTCIISFYGWGTLKKAQTCLAQRYTDVSSLIEQLNGTPENMRFATMQQMWDSYKTRTVLSEMQVHDL